MFLHRTCVSKKSFEDAGQFFNFWYSNRLFNVNLWDYFIAREKDRGCTVSHCERCMISKCVYNMLTCKCAARLASRLPDIAKFYDSIIGHNIFTISEFDERFKFYSAYNFDANFLICIHHYCYYILKIKIVYARYVL